ncbi:MAG TPA: TrkA C-terminal domain-containing protein, partial [Opitutales bacterium]|nr:TrkA C-terminal domain-containing protein [Opitutales bacterium]
SRLIDRLLRRYTSIEVRDFGSLLGLSGDYRVVELVVSASDWLAARTVAESELLEEGVLLLAIQRKDGQFIGTPTSDVCIEPEDSLVLYGHVDALENLDERRYGLQGNLEHEEAKAQKEERAREELESADRESGEDETG